MDAQTLFDYTAHLGDIKVPFLAIAGDKDTSDPMVDIYDCYQRVGSTMKTFVNVSNYGHMDIILGDDANVRVFPHIITWLEALPPE